jgi:hypothetical protein
MPDKTAYETGARKYPAKQRADASDEVSQDAAENKKPKDGIGLTRPLGEVNEKTRQSDGQNPSAVWPDTALKPDHK